MHLSASNPFLTTLFGIRTLQSWVDLILWEQILNEHPKFRCVIEIGTYKGGLAAFLSTQAQARGQEFFTCDIERQPEVDRLGLGDRFILDDALEGSRIGELLARDDLHPLLFYCDGGNKAAEFQKYVPLLRPGDCVGTHDWGTEFKLQDAEPVLSFLRPLAHERHAREGSMTRFWKRTLPGGRQPWGNIAVGVRIAKHPEPQFFIAWSALLTGGLRAGDTVLLPVSHTPAHWAANQLARDFLKTDRDSLLLMDDDMAFEPDAAERLRENQANWEYDVVEGFCTYRVWPPRPAALQLMEQPPFPMSRRGDHFDVDTGFKDGEVKEVGALGLAFTLIRREVLEAMVSPDVTAEFTYWFHYGQGMESDDIPFCRACREHGFRMAMDASVHVMHISALPLGWEQFQVWLRGEEAARQEARAHVDLAGNDLLPVLKAAMPHLEGVDKEKAAALLAAIEGAKA